MIVTTGVLDFSCSGNPPFFPAGPAFPRKLFPPHTNSSGHQRGDIRSMSCVFTSTPISINFFDQFPPLPPFLLQIRDSDHLGGFDDSLIALGTVTSVFFKVFNRPFSSWGEGLRMVALLRFALFGSTYLPQHPFLNPLPLFYETLSLQGPSLSLSSNSSFPVTCATFLRGASIGFGSSALFDFAWPLSLFTTTRGARPPLAWGEESLFLPL